MATIIKPASPGFQSVAVRYIKIKAIFESPLSLVSQTQIHPGEKWQFDLSLPPMTQSQAWAWIHFVMELNRDHDNFSFVCSPYVPAGVTSPRLVRLVGNVATWNVGELKRFGLNFTVEDDQ